MIFPSFFGTVYHFGQPMWKPLPGDTLDVYEELQCMTLLVNPEDFGRSDRRALNPNVFPWRCMKHVTWCETVVNPEEVYKYDIRWYKYMWSMICDVYRGSRRGSRRYGMNLVKVWKQVGWIDAAMADRQRGTFTTICICLLPLPCHIRSHACVYLPIYIFTSIYPSYTI